MYDDVTRPKGSVVVIAALKSKMAAVSTSSGGNSKRNKRKKTPASQIDGPATSENMSALLPFKFPASRKYDAILNSCVTTTTTMHVRAAKASLYVIMHNVYDITGRQYFSLYKLKLTTITTRSRANIAHFSVLAVTRLRSKISASGALVLTFTGYLVCKRMKQV